MVNNPKVHTILMRPGDSLQCNPADKEEASKLGEQPCRQLSGNNANALQGQHFQAMSSKSVELIKPSRKKVKCLWYIDTHTLH